MTIWRSGCSKKICKSIDKPKHNNKVSAFRVNPFKILYYVFPKAQDVYLLVVVRFRRVRVLLCVDVKHKPNVIVAILCFCVLDYTGYPAYKCALVFVHRFLTVLSYRGHSLSQIQHNYCLYWPYVKKQNHERQVEI